jgi:hypothetical protein
MKGLPRHNFIDCSDTTSYIVCYANLADFVPLPYAHYEIQFNKQHNCTIFRDHGILHGQQPEFSVCEVRLAGRSASARLHRAVFPKFGADRHVLPVQATGQGLRRRCGSSRDRCRAGEMFPHAQGQNKLTGVGISRLNRWAGGYGNSNLFFFFFITKYRQVQNT